ncbi:hypothetical protein GOBAR_DD23811 [Gossypium barbadense]|nr:hypothetical protein GOBAR_DD23811 [Gossypium barbadense]
MNLIAYEMCPDFYNNNFTVTSYMGFLDSLIDEAEDVKELRHSGILYNRLGSDKEVAKLIKKMNMVLVPSLMIYRHVKLQIHDHHKNMWIRYPAQVYRPFFRTRWTFFAFVGAIGALFIGALQAYYTIHQPNLKMSSTEEGGGAVGSPGGAISTDQTITTSTNPLKTIIPMPGIDFISAMVN